MTFRLRLSLTCSLVVAVVVAVLGAVLYLTMQSTLRGEMDRRLQVRAGEVQYALWPGGDSTELGTTGTAKLDLSLLSGIDPPAAMYVQVLAPSGTVQATSDNLQGRTLPFRRGDFVAALAGRLAFSDLTLASGRTIRVLSVPLGPRGHVTGVLQVSQPRDVLEEAMAGLRRLLVIIGSGATVLAGIIGWIVSYRGLRPLSLISQQAADIAAKKDFSWRLPLGPRRDEIGELARAFDGLLATVDETLQAHRDFVADTSHELRNPLLAIHTNAALINRVSQRERDECVQEILEQVERMRRLVSDLLLLAQVERGLVLELRPVDVLEVVERAVHEVSHRARGHKIRVWHQEALTITADGDRLGQILANLLDNAVKHTPPEGTITVRTQRAAEGVQIEVEDTGEGIAPEHLPRIFERTFHVNPSCAPGPTASYGLGLAIVKYLTEGHGGRVTVQSELGQGTCFTVWLPCARPSEQERLVSVSPLDRPGRSASPQAVASPA